MNYMIKDLKSMASGTEVKGLALMIKTARKAFTDVDNIWQEVVFMDSSGEMTGHIQLESEAARWKSKTNLCIMEGELQYTDERGMESNKLVVLECFDAATPLGYDQIQDLQAEDWKQLRQDEIKGKIRHGIVCSLLQSKEIALEPIAEKSKELIKDMVDFIITGE